MDLGEATTYNAEISNKSGNVKLKVAYRSRSSNENLPKIATTSLGDKM